MKRLAFLMAALLAFGTVGSAVAADFKFSGDLNNRFMLYTDQATMFSGAEKIGNVIDKDGRDEMWGDIKYRLQTEAATNDGNVKGVYAIELGAIRFGDSTRGGAFSGDGVNIETRFAYTDFQLPGVASKARFTIGLQPFTVNKFVWWETAMGVVLKGTAGAADYSLGWVRGKESFNNDKDDDLFEDMDAFLARVDLKPMDKAKVGLFALYQGSGSADEATNATNDSVVSYQLKRFNNVDYDIFTIGTDGSLALPTSYGNGFVNWDLIYQGGSIDAANFFNDNGTPATADDTLAATLADADISAFLVHLDLGINVGKTRLTYTGWYASGDDDTDTDIDNFMSTDVDTFDSIIFFEGGYTDDNYFTEAPHILNKGLILNKLALDYKATDKLALGAAVLYLMTAEDLTLANGAKEDALGTEIDAYVSYKLYPNVEVAVNAGFLAADDGMDFFEVASQQNGVSDADVFRSTARVRYKF